jgi:tripartite ATP-independent transporter DctP family solute receptor
MVKNAREHLRSTLGLSLVAGLGAAALLLGSVDALAQDKKAIKIGVVWAADHPGSKGASRLAELANAKAGGAIEVRVYPSEQLGSEREMFEGIRLGSIEMGYIAGNIIQNAEPSAGLPSLPYLFKGFEQAFKVEDGAVGKEISDRVLKATGARTLGFFSTGFRQVAAKKPLGSVTDFDGLKIRTPESPLLVATFKLLGANPTPMPFGELYTAIQTNVVDAAESPPGVLNWGKIFEVAPYMMKTSHIYSSGHILISENFWKGLAPNVQKALQEAATEAQQFQRGLVVDEESTIIGQLQSRANHPVTVVSIDTVPLREATASYYEEFAGQIGGMDLIDQAKAEAM